MVSVRLIPPDYQAGRTPDRYPISDESKMRSTVQTIMQLPPAQAAEVLGLVDLGDACGGPEPEPPPSTSTVPESETPTVLLAPGS